ncbi:GNAT superfamily N-acetyltransferase [Rhizomicrobium palustre]|uniref:GNAT superfamily N-acetyltransferase n=1 Tax=Rhizomicrobium palustre TaxID=189966 RepID=A0A846MYX7_9PROT|nr:GNAT family N-acetyltransferase [Rhizomicrobium palustre]NIK88838.1 GNAT superfamily N-acetyltransferase [Rhizomicrobium palustre]
MTDVRLGQREDGDKIAAMLGRAFINDPAMSFIFPDQEQRKTRMPLLFRQLFASDRKAGGVMMTPGGEAATLWRAPGRIAIPFLEELLNAKSYLKALGPHVFRAMGLSHAIEAQMPKGEFWYLHIAGCDPAAQGKGYGRAVIQAGLDQLVKTDACYLETGTERNLGFYRALGFELIGDWQVPGGPRLWSMLRPKA